MENRLAERKAFWPTILKGISTDNRPTLSTDRVYELAERDAFRDKMRAGLCKQAMDNTAMLAMAEEHLSSIAPTASAEYRKIVETYTSKALIEILRGEL